MQQPKRLVFGLTAALLALLMMNAIVAHPHPVAGATPPQSPFLQANGQQFVYNSTPITLYGTTIYTSRGGTAPSYNWTNPAFTQRIDWDLNLAQQAGYNLIRPTDQVNDPTVNVYDPVVWSNMDYLVQQAALRHMFVEIDMSTFANHLKKQGINPYNASLWTKFIQFVTARYKNATNVSNYSLEGEVQPVNATSGFTATAQGYIDFFNGVTTETYNDDGGHHLIAAGGLSFLNNPSYGIPWQQIFSLPHVNMTTIHTYPGDPNNPETTDHDLAITTPMVGAWAKQNNKPFEIEEYGFIQGLGDARRAAMIQREENTAFSNGASGLIVWNTGPEVLGGTHYDVNPSYPLSWQQIVSAAPGSTVQPATPTATGTRTSATPVLPTATNTRTPAPPTATSTATPIPPTATSTETPVPPTATNTNTPAAPTATHTPATPTATSTRTSTPVPPASTPTAAPGTCPNTWSCADVGSPLLAGNQSLSNGGMTISGAGSDIFGTSDQFHYVWQALAGDGSVSARVVTETNTNAWAKTGVMMRQSTDAQAPYYYLLLSASNVISVQYRTSYGAVAIDRYKASAAPPAYLRITRSGNVYTAYTSSDGVSWNAIAGSSVTMTMTSPVLAGLAVTSHNGAALNTAIVDHIGLTGAS